MASRVSQTGLTPTQQPVECICSTRRQGPSTCSNSAGTTTVKPCAPRLQPCGRQLLCELLQSQWQSLQWHAYYAKLNPGQNVGQNPNDYVDVNNKTYMDWTEPGASKLQKHSGSYQADPDTQSPSLIPVLPCNGQSLEAPKHMQSTLPLAQRTTGGSSFGCTRMLGRTCTMLMVGLATQSIGLTKSRSRDHITYYGGLGDGEQTWNVFERLYFLYFCLSLTPSFSLSELSAAD